jgi:Rps23 Pro-64 3,4-dihydroxylase Tpa1-like proline 4-hydroxylase
MYDGPVAGEQFCMDLERNVLAREICDRLDSRRHEIRQQWEQSAPVRHFVVDDVLPRKWAEQIRTAFPDGNAMTLRRSLREKKYVAAQMNRYDPLLEESIYGFQMPGVVERIGQITQIKALEPDHMLYAGGISVMSPGHFLNPHIDNSHDKMRQRYRVLNLLYYVSPQWPEDRGGNLELWQNGPTGTPTTITSRFNRLVVMITSPNSWHSVSRNHATANRCCVSNYYFSPHPIDGEDYYHVTSYRGRPEQPLRDVALRTDNWLRTMIRTNFPGAFKNPHFYDQPPADRRSNSGDAHFRAPPEGDGGE